MHVGISVDPSGINDVHSINKSMWRCGDRRCWIDKWSDEGNYFIEYLENGNIKWNY
jgi:hypothetical protein